MTFVGGAFSPCAAALKDRRFLLLPLLSSANIAGALDKGGPEAAAAAEEDVEEDDEEDDERDFWIASVGKGLWVNRHHTLLLMASWERMESLLRISVTIMSTAFSTSCIATRGISGSVVQSSDMMLLEVVSVFEEDEEEDEEGPLPLAWEVVAWLLSLELLLSRRYA